MPTITIRQRIPVVVELTGNQLAPNETTRPITINTGGTQGPPGAAGGTIAPIAFAWGDASGTIWTATATGTITYVRLVIETAYNGTNPSITIGTLAAPASMLAAADNSPGEVGEYEVTADVRVTSGTAVRITNTPGAGASQGAGLIYLTFIPD